MKVRNLKSLTLNKKIIVDFNINGGQHQHQQQQQQQQHPMGPYKERVKWAVGTRNTCQCETIASPC